MHTTVRMLIGTAALGVCAATSLPAPTKLAAQVAAPAPIAERAPDALPRVTWRTRTLVGDERLTGWKLALRFDDRTFLEAVLRADAAVMDFVEGHSSQHVSHDIPKAMDYHLTADEIAAIRARMGTIRLLTYRVHELSTDEAVRRRVFRFAGALGAETVIVPAGSAIDGLDTLAREFELNVALSSDAASPVGLAASLADRGPRLGIAIDTGRWAEEGIEPTKGLEVVKDRLFHVNLRDRAARGAQARNVPLGEGVGSLEGFFHELNRLEVRPVTMTLDTHGVVSRPADLFPTVDAFEAVVQPAYGVNFTAFSKTRPIRWDLVPPRQAEGMTADALAREAAKVRSAITAAVPTEPFATPQKPRRLLVIESLHGMSHNTIPHTNVMLEHFGTSTGAWTTTFSNDLDNLKYPKLAEFDGIFLNSVVGELFPDPDIRESVARFVREGGGLGGIHGTPWASRNWDEFADMIGAQDAPHRVERGVMRNYDPTSPLMKPFGNEPITFSEEYYRFRHEGRGRLRWSRVRVLLTVDLDEPTVEPRPWSGYRRPDGIYPVSWIQSYGQGRVFYSSLGHVPETFMTPELVGHFLAGVQFLLGDLDADTTPNPPS